MCRSINQSFLKEKKCPLGASLPNSSFILMLCGYRRLMSSGGINIGVWGKIAYQAKRTHTHTHTEVERTLYLLPHGSSLNFSVYIVTCNLFVPQEKEFSLSFRIPADRHIEYNTLTALEEYLKKRHTAFFGSWVCVCGCYHL